MLVGVLAIGFYLLVLAPKREKASELNDQIDQLHASISQQEQVGELRRAGAKGVPALLRPPGGARQGRPRAGRHRVDARAAEHDRRRLPCRLPRDRVGPGCGFRRQRHLRGQRARPRRRPPIRLPRLPAPRRRLRRGPPHPRPPRRRAHHPGDLGTTSTASATPVPATEASAAPLPIGAVVGPAGLPRSLTTLTFKGGYFDIANFIGGVDNLVEPTASGVRGHPGRAAVHRRRLRLQRRRCPGPHRGSRPTSLVTTYATPADPGPDARRHPQRSGAGSPRRSPTQPASAVVAK